ncbi:MAG: type II toxin-antitoxin system Phd/YefM family antitoxin [Burkholderiaceae bacterium]
MTIVNVHEAKTTLSDLIARAEAGEEIVIARANKPTVRLVPIETRRDRRVLGLNASPAFAIAADFDAPMVDEALWYDEPGTPHRKTRVATRHLQQPAAPYRKPRAK